MSAPEPSPDDADVAAAQTPSIARAAGIALFCAGLFAGLVGLQALTSLRFLTWLVALPILLTAGGPIAIGCGLLVLRARAAAAITGLLVAIALLLLSLAWVAGAISGGVVSPLSFLSVLFQLGAAAIVPLAIGPCRRTSAARARLRGADFDLGT